MAIAIISSELKTSSGNLTIPENCLNVIALVLGTTNPTINTVAMTQKCTVASGVSISEMTNPPTGTIPCTIGQSTRFVYLSSAGAVRNAQASNNGGLPLTITTVSGDLVLGVAKDNITALTGGGAAFTYLDNYSRGSKAATTTSLSCDASSSDPVFYAAFASVQELGTSTVDGSNIIVM